jgi:hypothetical protein
VAQKRPGLFRCGLVVRTANDGAEAIKVADAFKPDVVLLGTGMPKLNESEACREMKEKPWTPSLPGKALYLYRRRKRRATSGHPHRDLMTRNDQVWPGFRHDIAFLPCMTLRFGYQALWLTDVALTTDQLNQFSIFNGHGHVRKGNALYHGGFGGLVFTF